LFALIEAFSTALVLFFKATGLVVSRLMAEGACYFLWICIISTVAREEIFLTIV